MEKGRKKCASKKRHTNPRKCMKEKAIMGGEQEWWEGPTTDAGKWVRYFSYRMGSVVLE